MTRPIRVLLVEDNPGDADLVRDTLDTGARAIEITWLDDGARAAAYVSALAEPPDLVLLDLNLPRRDGREVLREIKKSDRLRAVPVVVLTSSDAEADILACYAAGASCYITKPLGLVAFQKVVRAID
ncbi:MAG TPA: response regulator, partial [Kofleriaceae bacterium]